MSGFVVRQVDQPSWGQTFNGVRRSERHLKTPRDILAQYCRDSGVSMGALRVLDWPVSQALRFWSDVKLVFHNNVDRLDRTWVNYMDIPTLAGYPRMQHREMKDDPVAWLSTPPLSHYSAQWWQDQFRWTFSKACSRWPTNILSYREYILARWLWSTGGASSLSKAKLDNESVKTKFGAAVSLSDQQLLDICLKPDPKIGVFLKPDQVGYKRRLIANVGLGGYVAAAYVRYVIQQFTGQSPMFMKLDTDAVDCLDVVALIRDGRLMMPLDQSAYDYHVSKQSWDGFFKFLFSVFPDNEGVSILFSFYKTGYWVWDGRKGDWLSGMPSGLALTSFLNSWMNFIKQRHVAPGSLQWAAGDDVLVAPFVPKTLNEISRQYSLFGSEVNAMKNWTSTKYAQYLKVVYTGCGTFGYPARIFSSLIWAGKARTFLPSDRLPQLSQLWKQYFDRLLVPFDVMRVSRDLSRSVSSKVSGFSSVVAREWLHTPRAYGGFGRLPYVGKSFTWVTEVLRRKKYTQVVVRVPDVNFYSDKVQLVRGSVSLDRKNFSLGKPFSLPPVQSMQQWQARLNGQDNPVKGQFRTMVLDPVPLPVIDFVSTARMAGFARSWGYNVFPNLRGRTDHIAQRLVSASSQLALQVRDWMQLNRLRFLSN